jgi:hypothetical protein
MAENPRKSEKYAMVWLSIKYKKLWHHAKYFCQVLGPVSVK